MTILLTFEDRYMLGSIGQAIATHLGRGMGYEVADVGFEFQASPVALQNLTLIGAELAGPDLMFTKPGDCFVADVKTTSRYELQPWDTSWTFSTRHITALEAYETHHRVPAHFQFCNPWERLIYTCPVYWVRSCMEAMGGGLWRIRAWQLPRYWMWSGDQEQLAA